MNSSNPAHRTIRSFVRREGRFTDAQKQAYVRLWPRYGLDDLAPGSSLEACFPKPGPLTLEIGFGNGNSLAEMALAEPQMNFIGIEVHRPGVGRLMNRLESEHIENVRIICQDAVEVLKTCIPDASLDRIQIFFPDPWPKKKHHKRRLVQYGLVVLLAEKLKTGGTLHLATDWQDYAEQMMEVVSKVELLENTAGAQAYAPRPPWRPLTKYESRGQRLGHGVWDLIFIRKDRNARPEGDTVVSRTDSSSPPQQ